MDSYPLHRVYTLAFHWGLSAVASLGSELKPISLAELYLGISVTMFGFWISSYVMGQIYSIILNLDR